MISKLTDWVLGKLVGSTTAHACLCQPRCWLVSCYHSSLCSYPRKRRALRCEGCNCNVYYQYDCSC